MPHDPCLSQKQKQDRSNENWDGEGLQAGHVEPCEQREDSKSHRKPLGKQRTKTVFLKVTQAEFPGDGAGETEGHWRQPGLRPNQSLCCVSLIHCHPPLSSFCT